MTERSATDGARAGSDTTQTRGLVRVGTCAWADHEEFYPPGVRPVDRLAYYAERFPVVEVNSSFYHILPSRNYGGWSARTPDGFAFNVKAFAQLSQHRREEPPTREAFASFRESYRPPAEARKLRAVLFRFPTWFTVSSGNEDYLRRVADEMADDQVVVEFRHASWLEPDRVPDTLALLSDLDLGYVVVDAPQVGTGTVPLVPGVTDADLAYVRLHGRNTRTWYQRTKTTGERFDYLYNAEELQALVPRVLDLAERAAEVHVLFNNNRRNYATVNAEQMQRLLGQLDRPASTDQGLQLLLLNEDLHAP